ncbi:MAG TPA: hypothetical protein VGC97_01615 [Pyrinomonadaceae bacterium]|jgi:hypothetical protein
MKRNSPIRRNFKSLSVKDLLEARDVYHVHLASLENVVATAIGLYRIRLKDPDINNPSAAKSRKNSPERTLANSVVKEWSYPCVLVFVKEWMTQEELVKQDPDQVVPRYLYLPDGRVVRTCVILAEKDEFAPPPLQNLSFPAHLVGGGYPLITDTQGQEHIGSIGCLVTDGDSVYALTNRHVTGIRRESEYKGRDIFTIVDGKRVRIGETDYNQTGKKAFSDVYPGWAGTQAFSNLDAGLIRVNDVSQWTAQVFGIGEIGELISLHRNNITLDLIGSPVRAFGGASGELVGKIEALFYRYKSVGGFDYISDLLIGPLDQKTPLRTLPGDSGTVWFYDPQLFPEDDKKSLKDQNPNALKVEKGVRARRFRPLALQWGGHTFLDKDGESQFRFALATCLSTVCRELDVDILSDWNIGHSEYWGKVGHYKIGAKACELPTTKKLKNFLVANLKNIAFDDQAIQDGVLGKLSDGFAPLADVPDLVWRTTRKKDEANHFADMDEIDDGTFPGKTLFDLCRDKANVEIDVWNRFYDSRGTNFKRGALPFRVWQLYSQMVKSLQSGKPEEYICAAGVLAHYVGDACQPLHVSHLHHGRPGHPEEEDVHSVYETNMLDRFAAELVVGVNNALNGEKFPSKVTGGKEAAIAVIELMRRTMSRIPPIEIIEVYNEVSPSRTKNMWQKLSGRTFECIADGSLTLANLWQSAWTEGKGSQIAASKLKELTHQQLRDLYDNKTFVESFRLQDPKFKTVL